MRILHVVTNADLGGAPRVVTELANRAVRDGHVCGAASVPEGPLWDHLDPRVERLPLDHLRRDISPAADLAAVFELARLFRRWKPDIVHLHSSKAGALGRFASLLAPVRIVYTIHGFDTILKSHRIFLPLERLLAGRTAVIVPVSAYDKKNLAAAGIRGRVELILNGVSDRCGAAPDATVAHRIGAARASGAAIVLSIARLAPPKRFDLFVEAARQFSPAEARFFWIGNAGPPELFPLPPSVELLGEVPEAGNCVNLCDVFVLFSDYEGLPMSVLEALSCGKPVVASGVGGIGEAVDGEVGVLVPNGRDAVVDALRSLLEDPARRDCLGAAARRRYEARFSADAMWGKYAQLYAIIRNEIA